MREPIEKRLWLTLWRCKNSDDEAAVGLPQITSAIATFADCVEIFDPLCARQGADSLKVLEKMVAHGVDIAGNMVRDLT